MNIFIVGEKENRTLHICVALTEVQESIEIMENLGYSIVYKDIHPYARFRRIRTNCLITLRRMTKST